MKQFPTMAEASASRNIQFLLLCLAATTAMFARTAISPLQETIRIALSLSDNQMALLQGPALALPMAITAIPMGLVIDRYSRVRLLFFFALLEVGGSLLTAIASGFAMLFLARCLVGLSVSVISTTAFSLLADLYAPDQRGRASMAVVIGQYIGMSAAFALGGALLEWVKSGPDDWRWATLWLTGPLILVAGVILAMREPQRVSVTIENPTVRESFAELWRYRALIGPLLAGLVLAEMAVLAVLTWAAPAFSRGYALPPERVGTIMAVVVLTSGLLGPTIGGVLADTCQRADGPRRTALV